MKPTHIIIHSQNDGAVLYRASDGMVLGARSGTMVNFGEDPKQTAQRHFIDKAAAIAYLRKLADDDALAKRAVAAIIEDRDDVKRIITAAEAIGSGILKQ